MNTKAQSKRLRLRLFPSDERFLDEMLRATTHTSKSNVIRAALALFTQVWTSVQGGFRVVFSREDTEEQPDVLDTALRPTGPKQAEDAGAARPRTEKSMEIRLTPSDLEKIEALRATGAADTYSEVVRRAIRLYAQVVSRHQQGWQVFAVSPSHDALPVGVPGLGSLTAGIRPRPPVLHPARGAGAARTGRTGDALPKSLASLIEELAAKEGCAYEALLVDMVRTETFRRLGTATQSEVLEEVGAVEGASVHPGPAELLEEVPAGPVETVASHQGAADEATMTDLAKTLDQMADSIENVMRLLGETSQSKDGQADFADLLFGTVADDTAGDSDAPAAGEGASTPEQLFRRASALNERLTALVALSETKTRKSSRRRARAKSKDEPAGADGAGEARQEQTGDAPALPEQQLIV